MSLKIDQPTKQRGAETIANDSLTIAKWPRDFS